MKKDVQDTFDAFSTLLTLKISELLKLILWQAPSKVYSAGRAQSPKSTSAKYMIVTSY